MKRFRIGNDIAITWDVKTSGKEVNLDDKDVNLYMTHAKGRETLTGFSVSGNVLSYTFLGLNQKVLGKYTITIDVRNADESRSRVLIQDKCSAFELVGRSCAECEDSEEMNYSIEL